MTDPRSIIPRRLREIMSPEALQILRRTLERIGADPDQIKELQELIDTKKVVRWMETPFFPGEFEESDDE